MRANNLKWANFLGLGLALAVNTPANLVADEAPVGQIAIRTVSASGTGCQPGTVSSTISPDAQVFSLLFDRYEAAAGGSAQARIDKKNCAIDVELQVPSGWSFTIFSADYRGFAAVDAGATAFHEVVYTFDKTAPAVAVPVASGSGRTIGSGSVAPRPPVTRTGNFSFTSKEFRGPMSSEYNIHNELPVQTLAWSPCNGSETQSLRVNTALLARILGTNNAARASLTLDSVDGALQQSFGIKWKRCAQLAPQPHPGPAPIPTNDTLAVYRQFNGRDNILTTNPSEGVRAGYRAMGMMFRVFAQPNNAFIPLFRCVNDRWRSHFLSTDAGCEGTRQEGVLGYISFTQRPGLVGLARYTNLSNPTERVVSIATNAGDRGSFRFEGFLGYGLQ